MAPPGSSAGGRRPETQPLPRPAGVGQSGCISETCGGSPRDRTAPTIAGSTGGTAPQFERQLYGLVTVGAGEISRGFLAQFPPGTRATAISGWGKGRLLPAGAGPS